MEVAPGIRRIGPGLANVYLFEEAGAVTIVDAGMPGYWRALPAELAAMGRTLEHVRAVVLTHAHSDHIGFAERIRTECGVPIRVHELDELRAKGPNWPTRRSRDSIASTRASSSQGTARRGTAVSRRQYAPRGRTGRRGGDRCLRQLRRRGRWWDGGMSTAFRGDRSA